MPPKMKWWSFRGVGRDVDIRFYYLQQAIRKGKVVNGITSFVGRERVWKKRYINRGSKWIELGL